MKIRGPENLGQPAEGYLGRGEERRLEKCRSGQFLLQRSEIPIGRYSY